MTAAPLRSLLFVPGARPDRFDKALAAGASGVILDLEDAVAPGDKDTAREAVLRYVQPGHRVIVRINAVDTPWFAHDLALCGRKGVAAIMLPKAEQADTVKRLVDAGAQSVLALIESAAGFAAMGQIAAAPRVAHLVFGSIDFQADLGMRDAPEDDLAAFRAALVLGSRVAGIGAPIDGVTVHLDDEARLRDDVTRARRLGFGGKLCIHPRQVALVNRLFAPSAEEQAWARRVIDAIEASGGGAVSVDGRMVDRPVVLRAQAILRESEPGA